MRRLGASALAAVALLAVVTVGSAATAQAQAPGAAPVEDVFYPDDREPADDTPAPATQDADREVASSRGEDGEREAALMRGSRQAADLLGYLPSLYQGKWYDPDVEPLRRCIMDRESNFNYRATSGTYHGAYQMSSALARGATWMMQREVRKEMGEEGVAILRALRELTPNKWNRYWQDRAFFTIWRDGAGAGHWRGGAHSC